MALDVPPLLPEKGRFAFLWRYLNMYVRGAAIANRLSQSPNTKINRTSIGTTIKATGTSPAKSEDTDNDPRWA